MDAVDCLMGKFATYYGASHKTLDAVFELGDAEWRRDNPPEGERYERFEARREELNEAAADSSAPMTCSWWRRSPCCRVPSTPRPDHWVRACLWRQLSRAVRAVRIS
ncbi:hypothetical protein [Candidatus Solirubrobacter pratensis]|uniref:hypothetical protein n=1 Tax=Candidatus Solirubrobacter pratensis TaxID=1298857 RepID=UPI0004853A96|nr:hypothetical protein [Candidatus Solirubrobacter pratensis]